jgi:hypothetical protein
MIDSLISSATKLLDKFIPDADTKIRIAHELATMAETHAQEIALGQMEVNAVQAAHKSLFVAGGRPAAMWVCVACMASNFILAPYAIAFGLDVPILDSGEFMPIMLGLLGLGGARTVEKIKGVARER